jgi:acetoin utilization protein AcuB
MKQHRWFYRRDAGEAVPLTVRDVMTPHPATLTPVDLVLDAMRLMREKEIRHVPIVAGSPPTLAGLVTETDVLRQVLHGRAMTGEEKYHATLDVMLPLERIMVRDVATLGPDDPVESAVRLFVERKIRCAPVVGADGAVAGIVTEADLMLLLQRMVD